MAAQKPDHDEDNNNNNKDDNNIHDPAPSLVISSPVRLTSSIPVPLYLQRTLSTASLAPTTDTLAVEDRNDGRQPKFDERFKTATLMEEEVLRMFPLFPMCFIFFSDYPKEKQIARWTSAIYAHFCMPPTISSKKGIVTYIYTCIVCVI
jgi:hypothetical protein